LHELKRFGWCGELDFAVGFMEYFSLEIAQHAGEVVAFEVEAHRIGGIGVDVDLQWWLPAFAPVLPASLFKDQVLLGEFADQIGDGLEGETAPPGDLDSGGGPVEPHELEDHPKVVGVRMEEVGS